MRNVIISAILVAALLFTLPSSSFAVYDPIAELSYLDAFPNEMQLDQSGKPNYIRYYSNSWMKKEIQKSALIKNRSKEKQYAKLTFFQKIAAWFGFL
jgi:hypothetical protein